MNWGDVALRLLVRARDRETISGDLLEEYREERRSAYIIPPGPAARIASRKNALLSEAKNGNASSQGGVRGTRGFCSARRFTVIQIHGCPAVSAGQVSGEPIQGL